jgi:predicted anti-sigma-YlaC factor YlaD
MKHKLFENWILSDIPLEKQQQSQLKAHLENCESCRLLFRNWTTSKKLIEQSIHQKPAPGFTSRWKETIIIKEQVAKIRRFRLSLLGLLLMAFLTSFIYLIVSGSFMELFANGFTMISELAVGLTYGLSNIGYWLGRLPIAVPITAGFIFFGLINAFLMAGIFFLWNLKQRKFQTNEIHLD